MNEHTERINLIMQDKMMTPAEFSKAIGIKMPALSHITSGRNNPSANVIKKILERFEDINPSWLLIGKGTMKIQTGDQNDGLIGRSDQASYQKNRNEDENKKELIQSGRERNLFDRQLFSSQTSGGSDTKISSGTTQTKSFQDANIRKESIESNDIRQAAELNKQENTNQIVEKEVIIYKEKPSKTIEHLLILYSDRTYETLISEKGL